MTFSAVDAQHAVPEGWGLAASDLRRYRPGMDAYWTVVELRELVWMLFWVLLAVVVVGLGLANWNILRQVKLQLLQTGMMMQHRYEDCVTERAELREDSPSLPPLRRKTLRALEQSYEAARKGRIDAQLWEQWHVAIVKGRQSVADDLTAVDPKGEAFPQVARCLLGAQQHVWRACPAFFPASGLPK